jgi:hypothetical protein
MINEIIFSNALNIEHLLLLVYTDLNIELKDSILELVLA